jgi:glycerol-3-phosphate acyltransferase PlsX
LDALEASSIVLDLMGGDFGPKVAIDAVHLALAEGLGPLTLVGTDEVIEGIPSSLRERVHVISAPEVIAMGESPSRAARAKKKSSMHMGMRAIREGEASAFVTAGNSGAALAVGVLTLKRMKGCDRPAIASVLPTATGEIVLLDLGANVEVRPAQYAQFAVLGAAYAQATLGVERPRVGLLSNGTELSKGTETLRNAHRLLSVTDLNYIGFVEGDSLPLGRCDVVVTDGFVGNVALKLTEGVIEGLGIRLKSHLRKSWRGKLIGALLRSTLRDFASEVDWRRFGGAPLLGLNGTVVVSHGRSDERALCEALRRARQLSMNDLQARLADALESTPYAGTVTSTAELSLLHSTTGPRSDQASEG